METQGTRWVYQQSAFSMSDEEAIRPLWTVGFYSPDGRWHAESDYSDKDDAARRCHYLNGGH